jgi:PAS domain S-box-containing protein
MVKFDDKVGLEPIHFSDMTSAIFALSPDAIVLSRVLDSKIIYFNQEFLNQIGYSREEVRGRSPIELNLWNHEERNAYLDKVRKKGSVYNIELSHRRKDGSFIDILYSSRIIRVEGEEFMLSIGKEITERKQAEKALKESEGRYRSLFKNNHAAMILINPKTGEIVDANPAAASFYGYNKEQLVKMNITDINMLTKEEVFGEMLKAQSGENNHFLFKHRLANGEIRDVNVYSGTIIISDENLLYSIIHDITRQMKAENALREKKEELQTIIDSSNTWIFYKDKENHFLQVNKAYAEFLGLPPEKLECMSLFDILSKEQAEAYWEDDKQVMKSGKPKVDIIGPLMYKDIVRYIQTDKIPYRDSNDNIIGIIGFAVDITERKKAEEELKRSMKELKRSNQELEQFAYIASHDLQEPLRMVSSFTQLLERQYKDKLDATASEYINYAVEGAKRMQLLINDLLSYSRVNTKGEKFEDVYLDKVLDDVLFNMEILIEENNATITKKSLPKICADYYQMVQVFQNLIGNAIKYRSEEKPQILISAQKEDDHWLFSVEDNGIGIESDYYEQVFKIFRRLHNHDEYEGTGIGLAITKRIIERHKGQIWVESEPGTGSNFHFTISRVLNTAF